MWQATGVRAHLYGFPLDVRVGVRLLAKHKWLTVVGTVAVAFAIAIGVSAFEFFTQMVWPKLPLEAGDRIVGIVMADVARGYDTRPTLHDFTAWHDGLKSVRDLAAFRTLDLNLVVGNGAAEPVRIAEISAAAFRVTRVQAALGRPLVAADERPGAPPVVVIGYDVWQTRFGLDPAVLGSEVRIGNVHYTIVGVMPSGFRFPFAHSFWVPLRLDALSYDRGRSPGIQVVGRLAPGAALETARSELAILGAIAAAEFPDTHKSLKPRVVPYIESVSDRKPGLTLGLTSINLLVVSLVCLICGNVALLMFARAATRENEIVVRTALGASRGRITGQFFVEALVLAAVAAVVGLTAARVGWGWVFDVVTRDVMGDGVRPVPFWLHRSLSRSAVAYAVLLTLGAAGIVGCLPARKLTRDLATRLRQAGPGGGLRFGRTWTVLIVMQVTFMAIVPVFLLIMQGESRESRTMAAGVETEQYLSAALSFDETMAERVSHDTLVARLGAMYRELERRLEAEPGVSAVTFAERLPLMDHPTRRIDVDEGGAAKVDEKYGYRRVASARVALDFFDAFGASILWGRGFDSGDLQPGAHTVIVNQSFVQLVLGGRNPIGRRLRYTSDDQFVGSRASREPWYEIVGVVRDMGMAKPSDPKKAGVYHPSATGTSFPLSMAIRASGDPLLLIPRVRAIATQVDPTIQLHHIGPLDQASGPDLRLARLVFWMITGLTFVTLLLSLVGIHAVFSFITTQRTREIGIRVALGGRPRDVAAAVFRRPAMQIGLGMAVGLSIALALVGRAGDAFPTFAAFVAMYGSLISAMAALAIAAPVRRALHVPPAEALRAE